MNMKGEGLYFLRSPIWKKPLKESQRLPATQSTTPSSELSACRVSPDCSREATLRLKTKSPAVNTSTFTSVDRSIGWYLLGLSSPTTSVMPTIDRLFGALIIVSNK